MPEIEVPLEDLEFKVKVPEGCSIVAALRLPSGQLVELSDLVEWDGRVVAVVERRDDEGLLEEMHELDPDGVVEMPPRATAKPMR